MIVGAQVHGWSGTTSHIAFPVAPSGGFGDRGFSISRGSRPGYIPPSLHQLSTSLLFLEHDSRPVRQHRIGCGPAALRDCEISSKRNSQSLTSCHPGPAGRITGIIVHFAVPGGGFGRGTFVGSRHPARMSSWRISLRMGLAPAGAGTARERCRADPGEFRGVNMGLGSRVFQLIHMRNLVYNTCWEDPRLDRQALEIGPQDNVLVITSAGCNALDYALTGPNHVYAVDMNPRQNALLDLKIAGIKQPRVRNVLRNVRHGKVAGCEDDLSREAARPSSRGSRKYWDRKIKFFSIAPPPVLLSRHLRHVCQDHERVHRPHRQAAALGRSAARCEDGGGAARDLQRAAPPPLVDAPMRFAMSREATMAMLGVPAFPARPYRTQFRGEDLSVSSTTASTRSSPSCRWPTTISGGSI